jgi:hypothetical protein
MSFPVLLAIAAASMFAGVATQVKPLTLPFIATA